MSTAVLVLGDNTLQRESVAQMLRFMNYRAIGCAERAGALNVLSCIQFDAMIVLSHERYEDGAYISAAVKPVQPNFKVLMMGAPRDPNILLPKFVDGVIPPLLYSRAIRRALEKVLSNEPASPPVASSQDAAFLGDPVPADRLTLISADH